MRPYYLKNLIRPGALCALLVCGSALALSTDKDQPIEIEADSAELDDKKGVTVYEGNVVVTQGSIRMTGDKMTVHYTGDNDLDRVFLNGRPATYRQLPDNSEVYDEAEAIQMEFYQANHLIVLISKARVKQQDVQFTGDRIEYDTVLSRIKARGVKQQIEPSTEGGATAPEQGRVKIIIKPPKKKE
ncbi:MAG: lipopolysaccharide transport periplasmic protein LptA [Gammaproteobacteria bacterium]